MTDLHVVDEPSVEDDDGEFSDPYVDDYTGPDPLFEGDTGQLSKTVRNVLVMLLKKRYISSERNPHEWQVMLANEASIRTRLNDLFLDLIIDRGYEVAYKKQGAAESGRFPTLLHDISYNREETVLLIHLRRLIRSQQKAGEEAVFVDKSDLIEEINHYRPSETTNHVAAEKAAENAVASLLKSDILIKSNDTDRYRIAPIIELLLPVDRIQELARWFMNENGTTPEADPDSTSGAVDVFEDDATVEPVPDDLPAPDTEK